MGGEVSPLDPTRPKLGSAPGLVTLLLLLFVVVYTETLACVVRPTDSTHQPGKPIFSGRYHRRFFGARQVRCRDQRAIPRQPIFIGHPTYVRPRGC